MMTPPTSKSSFLDRHVGNAAAKPAADDKEITQGGPAVADHKGRQAALELNPHINATPKFSTGPASEVGTFPTETDGTNRYP